MTADKAPPPTTDPDLPPAPWSAAEVAGAILFLSLLWPALARDALHAAGLFDRLYGPDVTALALRSDYGQAAGLALGGTGKQAVEALKESDQTKLTRERAGLWARAAALPFQLATVPLLFAFASGTRLRQLGLTTADAGRNVRRGLVVWLLLTPAVLGLHLLTLYVYDRLGVAPHEHPLTRLVQQGLTVTEWGLLLLAVVVSAPVLEEILFRGVLQPWLAVRPWGGTLAVGLAAAVTAAFRWSEVQAARGQGAGPLLEALAPLLFVVVVGPGLLVVRRWGPGAAAVYGTALLFAMVHTFAWPQPVPLFLLALGLGALARRTGSLVGPIVVHALFNATSIILFLLFGGP
jgi:membrane protease YdiL (CAAX protease family)